MENSRNRIELMMELPDGNLQLVLFAYANPDDPYDVIWHKLEEVFAPPQTAQMRFWRSLTREQLSGETVDNFYRSVVNHHEITPWEVHSNRKTICSRPLLSTEVAEMVFAYAHPDDPYFVNKIRK